MDSTNFIQATSIIRVKEKKLINKNKLNQLIEAQDFSKLKNLLSDTEYFENFSGLLDSEYEKVLEIEENKVLLFLKELLKGNDEILDYFFIEREYQNLKLKIKNIYYDDRIKFSQKSYINSEKLRKEILNDEKYLIENYEKYKDFQIMSIECDKLQLSKLKSISKKIGLSILNDYSNKMIDKYNILTTLRLKNLNKVKNEILNTLYSDKDKKIDIFEKYIETENINILQRQFNIYEELEEYQNTKNISDLEKKLENDILEIFKISKNITYGPEILISYYMYKKYEIKALRLIMIAKINNVSTDIIKARMRGIYV